VKPLAEVAVLGAGNGGQSMAADLALAGFPVNLFELESFSANLAPIQEKGGLELSGVGRMGFAKLNKITTDMQEAVKDAALIMVACAVPGHRPMMEAVAPHLRDGHVIVFNTGYWASLRFRDILAATGADAVIAETSILPYLCVVEGPAKARIDGIKQEVSVAAFPAKRNDYVYGLLRPLPINFVLESNVLEVNLNNINWIFHPGILLMNLALIENTGGDFTFYYQGVSPRVGKVIDRVDEERRAVGSALGLDLLSACEWLNKFYGAKGDNLYEAFHTCKAYEPSRYTHVLKDLAVSNFLTEDVPFGLVTVASFGDLVGVDTPIIDSLVNLANVINDEDYRAKGLTAVSLGLGGLDAAGVQRALREGF